MNYPSKLGFMPKESRLLIWRVLVVCHALQCRDGAHAVFLFFMLKQSSRLPEFPVMSFVLMFLTLPISTARKPPRIPQTLVLIEEAP